MSRLSEHVRLAVRRLRRTPGFTAVVLLTLALGIGANTAVFSAVHAVLLRPLPYRDAGRLVVVDHHYPSLEGLLAGVSAPGFVDYRARVRPFEAAAAQTWWAPNLTGRGEPERLTGMRVSGGYFALLGVGAARGRALRPDEDAPGRERVVVVSDAFWRRRGADPRLVGQTLLLDGVPHEVVGVMPPGFRDVADREVELWRPLALPAEAFADDLRTNEYLRMTARLRDGTTPAELRVALRTVAEQLKTAFPDSYPPDWGLVATPLRDKGTGGVRPALLLLLSAVGCVLLIACANVASLLLARAAARAREVALRTALGARRADLLRLSLTESLVLALAGGALGVGLAAAGVRVLGALDPGGALAGAGLRVDGAVLGYATLVSVLAGVVFGSAPVFQTRAGGVRDTLQAGGRGAVGDRRGHAARRALVVGEVALALVLLAGAGLLLKSFARLQGVAPGFVSERVLTVTLALPEARYPTADRQRAFLDAALARIGALPGVEAVGATSGIPFGPGGGTSTFGVEGLTLPPGQPAPWGDLRVVSRDFFRALQVPLRQGRTFTDDDRADAPPVAVVDEELARRYWPGQDARGKRISYGNGPDGAPRWLEIVGVVGHVKTEGLDGDPRVQVYRPASQVAVSSPTLAVRTRGDPRRALPGVREAVRALDPALPLARVATLDALVDASVGARRLAAVLLGAFAAIALLMASIGLYGLMSYAVTQRAREFGVRLALGARRGQVLALVVRQGMTLALAGAGLGLAGALALTRLLASQLFAVEPTDPATFLAVAGLLVAVALAATLVPALRATRAEPSQVLRQE